MPPVPVERAVSREEDRTQQPLPKPRTKAKKTNGVLPATAHYSSSSSIPTGLPTTQPPPIQPPPILSRSTTPPMRPLNTTKAAKVGPPGIIPRIKIANTSGTHPTQVSPPTTERPQTPPGGRTPPVLPSPKHTAKSLPPLPSSSRPLSRPLSTPAFDEDEFGYGLVNTDFIGVGDGKRKMASVSPASVSPTKGSPQRDSHASSGDGNNSSIMDTVSEVISFCLSFSLSIFLSFLSVFTHAFLLALFVIFAI